MLTLGPTQLAGKTVLNWQLLRAVPEYQKLKKIAVCLKPRDRAMSKYTEEFGFREVEDWPPRTKFSDLLGPKPAGYTVWPHHSFNVDADDAHLKDVIGRTIMSNYKDGDCILMLDEVYGLLELNLQKELLAVVTRGAGMGAGAWMASQKGSGTQGKAMPGFLLNNPRYYFLAHESEKNARQKYTDLAGDFDSAWIENITLNLPRYWFLYLDADGRAAIIRDH